MKHYIIVVSDYTIELEEMVNHWVKKEYQPIGGPFISVDNKLCQAMIGEKPTLKKMLKELKKEAA